MKIPKKIEIIDTLRSTETRLRFDDWEGVETRLQILHLAHKLNQVIDYLTQSPDIANEIPTRLKREGNTVVHEHNYQRIMRLGSHGFYECRECGQTLEKVEAN